jgi:ABC-type microcin C transport system permease subunit YejB
VLLPHTIEVEEHIAEIKVLLLLLLLLLLALLLLLLPPLLSLLLLAFAIVAVVAMGSTAQISASMSSHCRTEQVPMQHSWSCSSCCSSASCAGQRC